MTNLGITVFSLFFYIFFQSSSIYGGDAGDLASAAFTGGIPHPPGFPLYTFLGYLITRIPIGTVAWRMGFLSSIPAALNLALLYFSLKIIYKRSYLPLIATLCIGFSYPIWLYATVTEVFSLNAFFASLSVFLILSWRETHSHKTFLLFCLTYGLGFFHHQIIIFLLPGFLYFIYTYKRFLPKNPYKKYIFPISLFFLGAIPYIYTYFSARGIPAVMWGNPWNLENIIKLFLRDYYGTFTTGMTSVQNITTRFLSGWLFFEYVFEDFTFAGIILVFIGLIKQLGRIINNKKSSNEKFIFLLFFFSGPFYFFYAAYIVYGPFMVATAEKFLTFSYPFLAYYICEGLIYLVKLLLNIFNWIFWKNNSRLNVRYFLLIFIVIIPLGIFAINYPKLSVLKNDFTAERYAEDIFKTMPKNSIFFVQRDTTIFDSFYYYYTKLLRKDIKLFYLHRIVINEYREQTQKYYPELIIPKGSGDNFLNAFINANYARFPIYSNTIFDYDPGKSGFQWVRYGLLYRLYKQKDTPKSQKIVKDNEELWRRYNNPLSGSLKSYNNLFLGNVLDFYAEGHREFGAFLTRLKMYDKAILQCREALKLNPRDKDSYFQESEIFFINKKCRKAEEFLGKAENIAKENKDIVSLNVYLYAKYQIAKDCYKDTKRTEELLKKINEAVKKQQVPIDKL